MAIADCSQEGESFSSLPTLSFLIVLCVISLTFNLVDCSSSYVFINSSTSKMSTHSQAQIWSKEKEPTPHSLSLLLYAQWANRRI